MIDELVPKKSIVLDMGFGKGKDSFFLIKKGFLVEGIDSSKKAVKHMNNPDFHHKDVRKFKFRKKYDMVICKLVLHYFKSRKLIDSLKKNTNKNGVNVISVFTKDIPDYSKKMEKSYGLHMFDKNELKRYYADWKIIKYSERLMVDKSHGPKHHHRIAELIARKQ